MMDKISVRHEGEVAIIKMNDGKANAMNPAFFNELNPALDQVEKSTAKMLIIEGREGFFSGGLDLKYLLNVHPEQLKGFTDLFARTLLRIFSFPIPTMAACTGHAIAGGAMLALACDRRFAKNGPFRFQINEVAIGVALPSWMLLLGSSAIPLRWQTEALLYAHVYLLSEAVDKGIFESMAPDGTDVVSHIKECTTDIASLNMTAYSLSKKRWRESAVKQVIDRLANELPGVET
jgi:enoyl-CoA hydratase